MSPFYVIGHKNPDTDAICSALGYAALLRVTGEEANAVAARCGEISQRTKWVLERAGLEAPVLITDVRTNAGMISHSEVVKVTASDTFLTAYRRMLNAEIRCVPVEDEDGNLWSSAGDGVHCIAPDGHLMGKILVPEVVSNICFGGRAKHRLFITATTSLYSVILNRKGVQWP